MSRRSWLMFGVASAFLMASTLAQRGALADTPSLGKTGATPSFASLPEGHVPKIPIGRVPPHIGAGEKAAGFIATRGPRDAAGADYFLTYVVGDAMYAKNPMGSMMSDSMNDVCLVDGGDANTLRRDGDVESRAASPTGGWGTNYSALVSQYYERVPKPGGSYPDVHLLLRERFVPEGDGRASLELADAWFDARTRGVRLVTRSTLPLARIYVGPNGLELYAARDGDDLQLVVRGRTLADLDPKVAERVRSRLSSGLRMILPSHHDPTSNCGHLRVALRATDIDEQQATFDFDAVLPALEGHVPPAPEGETEDAKADRMFQSMRQRPYQLSVSMSTSSADKAPVLSIGLGWSGRERGIGS
jgi:hypothetical protein